MISLHVDVGQIIIGVLITLVGYFLKKEVSTVCDRLDKHDEVLFIMNATVATAIKQIEVLFALLGVERRREERDK